jgi:hypothetical protein
VPILDLQRQKCRVPVQMESRTTKKNDLKRNSIIDPISSGITLVEEAFTVMATFT